MPRLKWNEELRREHMEQPFAERSDQPDVEWETGMAATLKYIPGVMRSGRGTVRGEPFVIEEIRTHLR